MCGIAGIFHTDGAPASEIDVARMVAAMPHRGPNGHGTFAAGPVALGHGRLAVRDLGPGGAQPLRDPAGRGVLVYNGEVYNDRELRADLQREGVAFAGTGDAEVVLHATARWGVEEAVRRFDGMFALAWWDARDGALWLARDRFGIKPLHVAQAGGRLAFASELRGLRALPGVADRPDPLELARRILPWIADVDRPPFLGVENVLPGEAWRVGPDGVDRRTWCDVAGEIDVDRLRAAAHERPEAWVARTREALEAEVVTHLASDVPVVAFTSGGVDSNLVAAIAHRHRPDLVAYTLDAGGEESEAAAATEIARHAGFPLRVVRCDRETFLRSWATSVAAHEHPLSHPSQVAMVPLVERAHADGAVVAVTGEGADELFGGYEFLAKTWHRWRRARSPLRRWTHAGRVEARALEETPFDYQLIRKEPRAHLRMAATLAPIEESRAHGLMARFAAIEPAEDRAFLAHSLDALRRHLGWILLRQDRLGMAASIEVRVPYLSTRVADVGLHLPREAKLRRGVAKWALKQVAAAHLPPGPIRARKKGFPVPSSYDAGTTHLLRGGVVASLFRWSRAAEAELVPRIEADGVLRHQMVGLEIWGRLYAAGESAASITDRLLAGS